MNEKTKSVKKLNIMEQQIRILEVEVGNLKRQKASLENSLKVGNRNLNEDEYWNYNNYEIQLQENQIADIEKKLKSRQQILQALKNNQINSSTNQSLREIQELKQIIIRMERKIDSLNSKVDNLTNKVAFIE